MVVSARRSFCTRPRRALVAPGRAFVMALPFAPAGGSAPAQTCSRGAAQQVVFARGAALGDVLRRAVRSAPRPLHTSVVGAPRVRTTGRARPGAAPGRGRRRGLRGGRPEATRVRGACAWPYPQAKPPGDTNGDTGPVRFLFLWAIAGHPQAHHATSRPAPPPWAFATPRPPSPSPPVRRAPVPRERAAPTLAAYGSVCRAALLAKATTGTSW
jgi:hypothetical protein